MSDVKIKEGTDKGIFIAELPEPKPKIQYNEEELSFEQIRDNLYDDVRGVSTEPKVVNENLLRPAKEQSDEFLQKRKENIEKYNKEQEILKESNKNFQEHLDKNLGFTLSQTVSSDDSGVVKQSFDPEDVSTSGSKITYDANTYKYGDKPDAEVQDDLYNDVVVEKKEVNYKKIAEELKEGTDNGYEMGEVPKAQPKNNVKKSKLAKFGKYGAVAIGASALIGGGLVLALSDRRGQQTNGQLYGQQPLY